ncbi:MAG: hypothetical protein ACJAYE_002004 [Candidatus Azotimanducaceae bacterium]|jgi:hypothetical protein
MLDKRRNAPHTELNPGLGPELNLELKVARRGIVGFLKLNPTVDCLDYSQSGLQFGSDQAFRIDEKLVLDLRVWDMELDEINAVVVECEHLDNGLYCTRVEFCFLETHMKHPRITRALLQIEDRLRIEREYPS